MPLDCLQRFHTPSGTPKLETAMVRMIRLTMIVETIVSGPTHMSLRRARCSRSSIDAMIDLLLSSNERLPSWAINPVMFFQ